MSRVDKVEAYYDWADGLSPEEFGAIIVNQSCLSRRELLKKCLTDSKFAAEVNDYAGQALYRCEQCGEYFDNPCDLGQRDICQECLESEATRRRRAETVEPYDLKDCGTGNPADGESASA